MITYVKNGVSNIRFDFEHVKLISTTSEKAKYLENESGRLYLSDSGHVRFFVQQALVTAKVYEAVREGNKVKIRSTHSDWVFEIEMK